MKLFKKLFIFSLILLSLILFACSRVGTPGEEIRGDAGSSFGLESACSYLTAEEVSSVCEVNVIETKPYFDELGGETKCQYRYQYRNTLSDRPNAYATGETVVLRVSNRRVFTNPASDWEPKNVEGFEEPIYYGNVFDTPAFFYNGREYEIMVPLWPDNKCVNNFEKKLQLARMIKAKL